MKVLVAGGAGFIGSHLVDRLIGLGHGVAVIDNLSSGRKENLNKGAVFYNMDICDAGLDEVFDRERPDIVFHLAAQIDVRQSVMDPIADAGTNILGSLNLLQNAKKTGVTKFIFTSTGGAIYGDADLIPTPETYREFPLSPYGIAKLSIEKYLYCYCKVFGLNYTILRLANVYGPRQNSKGEAGVVAIFCDKMLAGKQPVINGSGGQTRDFVYVDDVIEAQIAAMRPEITGIFNIGTGIETDINQIFRQIKQVSGSKCEEIHTAANSGEQQRSCLDASKAGLELGWTPEKPLAAGIEATVNWFKNRPNGDIKSEKKRFWIFLAGLALFWAAATVLGENGAAIRNKMSDWKLVPEAERFTELYFDNYESLPRRIDGGGALAFSFAIRNLEGAVTDYPYAVYVERQDGRRDIVSGGAIRLADRENKTVSVSNKIEDGAAANKIVVRLTNLNQEISFLLTNNK